MQGLLFQHYFRKFEDL